MFQRVANLERAADVKTMIDERRALVAVQIDQDFERRLLSGQSAAVQVIADGRNSNTAGTALNYVGTVVDSFNTKWWAAHGGGGPPVRVTTRTWYNENLVDRWSIIPGLIGTLTLPEMLLMTAMCVAREKEEGTFDQLLVTPFRPGRTHDWQGVAFAARVPQPSPPSSCWSLSCGSGFLSQVRSSRFILALPYFFWR